jgi:hypothetical protein
MRDVFLFMLMVLFLNFFFRGEPNLYDLLHERAIEAASKEKNT